MKDEKLNHSTSDKEIETNGSEKTAKLLSRLRRKRQNHEVEEKEKEPKKKTRVHLRILPIWLRIILVILLLIGVTAIGLSIGYGYVGDGNPIDVFKKETWTHIVDIIRGKE